MYQSTFDAERAALAPEEQALALAERELAARRASLATKQADISRREREARNAVLLANLDALLALTPQHSRSSCSDADPENYWRGECLRCVLLQAKEQGHLSDDIEIELSVRSIGYEEGSYR